MSGGAFDYKQHQIIALKEELDNGMKQFRKEEEEPIREEIEQEFINAKRALKRAYVYLQRFDWLFSGDDGQDSFLKRIKEDLKEVG